MSRGVDFEISNPCAITSSLLKVEGKSSLITNTCLLPYSVAMMAMDFYSSGTISPIDFSFFTLPWLRYFVIAIEK